MSQSLPILLIALLVCAGLIAIILLNPTIPLGGSLKGKRLRIPYWAAPLLGALALLFSGLLPIKNAWEGLTGSGSINPLKILVLFISMTTLSIFLDEAGMFRFLAGIALRYAKTSQVKLFLCLYLLVAVLTVFTSNDIIILTFTPFICYFSKNAKINPIPYLFGEFVAANTWSMMLIIGNPTNIYLASSAGIHFGEYTAVMVLPTLLAGLVALGLLLLIFQKSLKQPISLSEETYKIKNPVLVRIGVIHLGLCTILLVISSYIGLEMYLITLGFAVSLFVWVLIYRKVKRKRNNILLHTLSRAPWELIPFVISMFLLVLALEQAGITGRIAALFGTTGTIWKYGIASFLTANLMNNIPMAVAFSSIAGQLAGGGSVLSDTTALVTAGNTALSDTTYLMAVYASVIGSNLGAFFTPLGALAGIMWSGILKRLEVPFSFGKYVSYGVRLSLPTLAAALAGLWIVFSYLV